MKVQESDIQIYRGVVCLDCTQPIPIPALVARIEAQYLEDATPAADRTCRVFNLRCLACGKEKPYKLGEIVDFSGTPPQAPHVRPAPAYLDSLLRKQKAATA